MLDRHAAVGCAIVKGCFGWLLNWCRWRVRSETRHDIHSVLIIHRLLHVLHGSRTDVLLEPPDCAR